MKRASLLVVLVACGGGSSGGPDAAPDGPPGSGRDRVGLIDIFEDRTMYDDLGTPVENRWSWWTARFMAGREPQFHRQTMAIGACTMREYIPSSCDPVCVDALCVDTNVCEPWGTFVEAGRMTITGLTVPQVIDPAGGGYYPPGQLPENLFADDATVAVQLAGDAIPALTVTAGGVPEIDPMIVSKITLSNGVDHSIRWNPVPGGDHQVRVTINSNNAGHGAPYFAIIECNAADSAGEVTIPAAMIDAFPEAMASNICAGRDCPPSTIRRYRRGVAPVGADQEVELMVSSQFSFGVDHEVP